MISVQPHSYLAQLTDLERFVIFVVEHEEKYGNIIVGPVLGRLVDRESEVFTVCLLRFELFELVGLHVEEAGDAFSACS